MTLLLLAASMISSRYGTCAKITHLNYDTSWKAMRLELSLWPWVPMVKVSEVNSRKRTGNTLKIHFSTAIASSSLDSSMCLWNARTGEKKHMLTLGPVDLWTVGFSPCNKYVISGLNDGKISMYSVETGKPEQVLDAQNGKYTLSIAYVSRWTDLPKHRTPRNPFATFRVLMVNILPMGQLMVSSPSLMSLPEKSHKRLRDTQCLCAACASRQTRKCCLPARTMATWSYTMCK